MILVLAVIPHHIILARSHQLLHEGKKCRHLCSSICQFIRYHGRNNGSLQIAAHRFEEQAAVLRDFFGYQFPGTLNLVEVLHGALRIRKVVQHLVFHLVNPFQRSGYCHFRCNDFLLRLLAVLVDLLQGCGLTQYGRSQRRVGLLGKERSFTYQ